MWKDDQDKNFDSDSDSVIILANVNVSLVVWTPVGQQVNEKAHYLVI